MKTIFDGITNLVDVLKGDLWADAKAILLVTLSLAVGKIFGMGYQQGTSFVLLSAVFVVFIVCFIYLLKAAKKSEKKR